MQAYSNYTESSNDVPIVTPRPKPADILDDIRSKLQAVNKDPERAEQLLTLGVRILRERQAIRANRVGGRR